jgi:hypothetical protein
VRWSRLGFRREVVRFEGSRRELGCRVHKILQSGLEVACVGFVGIIG